MLMKVGIHLKLLPGIILFCVVLSICLPLFTQSAQPALAANEEYTFFFKNDDKSDVKKGLDADSDDLARNKLTNTAIYARGGVFGNSKMAFYYDAQSSSLANKPQYKLTYYCANNKLETSKPTSSPAYQTIELTITPSFQGNDLDKNILPSKVTSDVTNTGPGPNSIPGACKPGALNGRGDQSLLNYNKLTAEAKARWGGLQTSTEANAATNPSTSAGEGEEEQTCQSEGGALAWMLCPTIDIIHDTVGALMKDFILNQLEYDPLSTDTSGGTSASSNIYKVWQAIRNLANVLFVLIFLFIVFANTVGMNVNAYTVKKMLPRLVAAVLLVQLSFLISALIIDAGNIAGQGIGTLISQALPDSATEGAASGLGIGWNILTNAILAVLAVGIIAKVGIATVILLAIAAVISVLSVVITLVLRDLIISVLVITSPLAFAAWVLPGTQKVFQTWWRLFIRIIIMYPMIALLFSMSSVLSAASTGATGGEGFVQSIIAGIFPIIAFFMVPWTFKWAGGAMAMTAGYVSGIANRTSGGLDKGIRNSRPYKASQERRGLKGVEKFGNQLGSKNPFMSALGSYRATGAPLGGRLSRDGGIFRASPIAAQKQVAAQQQAWSQAQEHLSAVDGEELNKTILNPKANKTQMVAAAGELAKRGQLSGDHIQAIKRTFGNDEVGGSRAIAFAKSQIKDRKANPIVSAASWKDFDSSGKMNLTEGTTSRIIQQTSPKALGDLSVSGLEAMEKTETHDGRKVIEHVNTNVIKTALETGSISGGMNQDVRSRLEEIVRNRGEALGNTQGSSGSGGTQSAPLQPSGWSAKTSTGTSTAPKGTTVNYNRGQK